MKTIHIAAISAALFCAGSAFADVIALKDGRSFSGSIIGDGKSMLITTDKGESISISSDDIQKVYLVSDITPQQAASAEWTRVSVLVKNATSLQTIISLHQKFLEKFPDQPVSASVKASLVEYQLLARQNGVKFRGLWMPAGQVDITLKEWREKARPALLLCQAGHLREALASAQSAIDEDPQNGDALAVAGMTAYRLNNLNQARDYFLAMAGADPSSVIAENNLAVISAQQGRDFDSLVHYTRALQAMPDNRLVLDNIEEELTAYTGKQAIAAYVDLLRQFSEMETRMEGEMQKKGLYRFGSTWTTLDQIEKLSAVQHDIDIALANLEDQCKTVQLGGAALDDALADAQQDYNDALNNLAMLDAQISAARGRNDIWFLISRRQSLAADADLLHRRLLALQAQRDSTRQGLTDYITQLNKLKDAQKQLNAARYSGIQRMLDIGEDQNPPPPVVVAPNIPVPVIAAVPQPGTVVVIHTNNGGSPDDIDSIPYTQVVTPFGVPFFPGRNFHNGNGHEENRGNGTSNNGGPGDNHGSSGSNGSGQNHSGQPGRTSSGVETLGGEPGHHFVSGGDNHLGAGTDRLGGGSDHFGGGAGESHGGGSDSHSSSGGGDSRGGDSGHDSGGNSNSNSNNQNSH